MLITTLAIALKLYKRTCYTWHGISSTITDNYHPNNCYIRGSNASVLCMFCTQTESTTKERTQVVTRRRRCMSFGSASTSLWCTSPRGNTGSGFARALDWIQFPFKLVFVNWEHNFDVFVMEMSIVTHSDLCRM